MLRKETDGFKIVTRVLIGLIILTVIALLINVGLYMRRDYELRTHPLDYSDLVEKYAKQYDLDKFLVYAVIKTESGFNPEAVSSDKARGLMQIMPDTFDWISEYRLYEDNISFDDMFNPDDNIRYGCYLISYHMKHYNNVEAAMAAYHAGDGNVDEWLKNPDYSANGKTLDKIPVKDTAHYVSKINKAYETYLELYG